MATGGNQIRLGLDAISIVIDDTLTTLAELAMNGPFNEAEFFSG